MAYSFSHTIYQDMLDFHNFILPPNEHLKLFHVNIRSLNKNHDLLIAYLSTIGIDFDIIVLSELWIYNLPLYKNILPGFNFHYQINEQNQSSGIGVLISSKFHYSCTTDQIIDSCEYIRLTLHCLGSSRKLLNIHCVYRHPGQLHPNFLSMLESHIQASNKGLNRQMLVGDLNINILDASSNATHLYMNMLSEYCFLPLILTPTRVCQQSSTLIDHIMYNGCMDSKVYSGNLQTDITDHLASYTIIPTTLSTSATKSRPSVRIYSEKNILSFRKSVFEKIINTQNTTAENDSVEELFHTFYAHVQESFENSFPLVRKSIQCHKMKPWLSKSLLKQIRIKNRLYKKVLQTNCEKLKAEYSQIKRYTEGLIHRAKQAYYQNEFQKSSSNIKKTWQILNNMLGRNQINEPLAEIQYKGVIYKTSHDIAEAFNKYFSNIAGSIQDQIPHLDFQYNGQIVEQSLMLDSTCADEILAIIMNMKNKSSTGGYDKFNIKHIKFVADILASPLSQLYNKCMENGVFPRMLKISKVIPIHKCASKDDPNNFRPISLQSVFSKIFEKVIKSRLQSFLGKYNLLSFDQYGFRRNSSTTLAILDLVQNVELNQNSKKHTAIIFLDLKKAFDTVNYTILLKNWKCMGAEELFSSSFILTLQEECNILK